MLDTSTERRQGSREAGEQAGSPGGSGLGHEGQRIEGGKYLDAQLMPSKEDLQGKNENGAWNGTVGRDNKNT